MSLRYIDPLDFRDLRKMARLTRSQVAGLLNVTPRTIQNWETGGARIPWMAYRMLRLLTGYALPGKAWDGWMIRGDTLWSPDNRGFTATDLYWLQNTFAQARLFRQLYARSGTALPVSSVLPFPDRNRGCGALPAARRPRTLLFEGAAEPLLVDQLALRTGGLR